jgi:hypothetical protein
MRRIALSEPTMTDGKSRFPLTLYRTVALALAACILSGFGGSGPKIPKPNDVLAPPPPAPSVEEPVVHLHVSLALNDLAFATDAAVPMRGRK